MTENDNPVARIIIATILLFPVMAGAIFFAVIESVAKTLTEYVNLVKEAGKVMDDHEKEDNENWDWKDDDDEGFGSRPYWDAHR